jgi:hypothetical protein
MMIEEGSIAGGENSGGDDLEEGGGEDLGHAAAGGAGVYVAIEMEVAIADADAGEEGEVFCEGGV